ncbi:FHA domain-containing protein [Nocardia sp. NPDC050697]|uniref:FHA domain-containing protein n=1 Tax=Nocardia sp. NPDC050697 TaxID=3155158 RepID=UPI0033F6CA52
MGGISMAKRRLDARATLPDKDALPPGAHRDLVVGCLAFLDSRSGYISYRKLSEMMKEEDVPATASPNTISDIMNGRKLGTWPVVQSLIMVLGKNVTFEATSLKGELHTAKQLWDRASNPATESLTQQIEVHRERGGKDYLTYKPTMAETSDLNPFNLLYINIVFSVVLICTRGPLHGETFCIRKGQPRQLVIGRDPECDLHLEEKSVSRRHAILDLNRESKAWVLRDDSSTNGTYANYKRLEGGEAKRLACGDIIHIGANRFTFIEGKEWNQLTQYERSRMLPI